MTSPALHSRFLLARLPTGQVESFLRALHATGIRVDPRDEVTCMDSSTPKLSTLMVWTLCPGKVHERWLRDPRVLGLREGEPPL